jgi:hypothetical protein
VSLTSPSPAPPGWYPDPAGERQWRVWTGAQWSHLTRPYGPLVDANQVSTHLTLLQALRRLLRYGIVGSFSGLAIIVGVLAHWPGTAHPASLTFCVIALDAGLALLVIGSASFAFAARELDGRWSPRALIPGVNLMWVNALVTRRLGGRPARRVASETVLLALFVIQFHGQPWLGVAPMVVAVGQAQWTSTLIGQLTRPAKGATTSP